LSCLAIPVVNLHKKPRSVPASLWG
jgi:hypothetical protein